MALKGNRLSIFIDLGGYNKPIGMAMDSTLRVNGDVIEKAAMSARAKAYKASRYGWRISCSALYCADPDASTYAQQLYVLTRLIKGMPMRVIYTEAIAVDGLLEADSNSSVTYSGEVIVYDYVVNAPVKGYANITIELQGTGELDIIAENYSSVYDLGDAASVETGVIDLEDAASVETGVIDLGESI